MNETLDFERKRLDHVQDTQGGDAVIELVIRNYGVYLKWLRNTKRKKSMCNYRSIVTSIVYYRNLLRSWDLIYGAGSYA